MTIDKDQAPILQAIIKTTYGPVLMRTLAHYIMRHLDEIIRSMQITTKMRLTVMQRLRLIDEQLQSSQVRRALLVGLDALKRQRGDLANELILQYGLKLPPDEIDFYQDYMQQLLMGHEKQMEEWIWNGDYDAIKHTLNYSETNDIQTRLH